MADLMRRRPGFTDGQQCTPLVTGMVVGRYFVVLIRAGPGGCGAALGDLSWAQADRGGGPRQAGPPDGPACLILGGRKGMACWTLAAVGGASGSHGIVRPPGPGQSDLPSRYTANLLVADT